MPEGEGSSSPDGAARFWDFLFQFLALLSSPTAHFLSSLWGNWALLADDTPKTASDGRPGSILSELRSAMDFGDRQQCTQRSWWSMSQGDGHAPDCRLGWEQDAVGCRRLRRHLSESPIEAAVGLARSPSDALCSALAQGFNELDYSEVLSELQELP